MIGGFRFPAGIDQTIRYAGNANTALSMIIIGNILAEVKPSEILDGRAFWFCAVRLLLIPLIVLFGSEAVIAPGTETIGAIFAADGASGIWSSYIRYIGALRRGHRHSHAKTKTPPHHFR